MKETKYAEALFPTPEQREAGTVTYRIYLDGAWRNIEGQASWKTLPQPELIKKIEQVYFTPK